MKVDSSAISSVSYSEKNRVLTIEFLHGGRYSYENVPRYRFRKLTREASTGREFHKRVRDQFNYAKIGG